jgi:hypothetical protein
MHKGKSFRYWFQISRLRDKLTGLQFLLLAPGGTASVLHTDTTRFDSLEKHQLMRL